MAPLALGFFLHNFFTLQWPSVLNGPAVYPAASFAGGAGPSAMERGGRRSEDLERQKGEERACAACCLFPPTPGWLGVQSHQRRTIGSRAPV